MSSSSSSRVENNKSNNNNLPRVEANVLRGHEGAVLAARFNKNGEYCLSCGKDRTIRLWNPHRGLHIKTYKSHGREVRDVHVTEYLFFFILYMFIYLIICWLIDCWFLNWIKTKIGIIRSWVRVEVIGRFSIGTSPLVVSFASSAAMIVRSVYNNILDFSLLFDSLTVYNKYIIVVVDWRTPLEIYLPL